MNGGPEEGEGEDHRAMKNQQMQNTKMARMRDGWEGAAKEAGIIMHAARHSQQTGRRTQPSRAERCWAALANRSHESSSRTR